MLEIAARNAGKSGFQERLTFCEMGVAEPGNEPDESFDAIVSGLCFSELTEDEVVFIYDRPRGKPVVYRSATLRTDHSVGCNIPDGSSSDQY